MADLKTSSIRGSLNVNSDINMIAGQSINFNSGSTSGTGYARVTSSATYKDLFLDGGGGYVYIRPNMVNGDNTNQFTFRNTGVAVLPILDSGCRIGSSSGYTLGNITPKTTDSGWRSFSWTNSTYIGTTQSSYTANKWRVRNDILFISIGAGATSNINTSSEIELARIPITGNTSFNSSSTRIWNAGVGGSGAMCGFMIMQNSSYISIYLKGHTDSKDAVAPWYSTFFMVPLDSGYSIS